MMNLDQARAGGGEGTLASVDKKEKDKNVELEETPPIFQSKEAPLKVSVPEGWSVK